MDRYLAVGAEYVIATAFESKDVIIYLYPSWFEHGRCGTSRP
jgi:hypothetical protein